MENSMITFSLRCISKGNKLNMLNNKIAVSINEEQKENIE